MEGVGNKNKRKGVRSERYEKDLHGRLYMWKVAVKIRTSSHGDKEPFSSLAVRWGD